MNRKFRVWCKDFNEWEKDIILLTEDGLPMHYDLKNGLRSIQIDSHIVQFSTGTFDKKGVEIFEGDICEYELTVDKIQEDGFKGEVIFRKCAFQLDGSKYEESVVYFEDFLISESEANLTVIGHIYENTDKKV